MKMARTLVSLSATSLPILLKFSWTKVCILGGMRKCSRMQCEKRQRKPLSIFAKCIRRNNSHFETGSARSGLLLGHSKDLDSGEPYRWQLASGSCFGADVNGQCRKGN